MGSARRKQGVQINKRGKTGQINQHFLQMPSTVDRRLGFGSFRKRWLLYGVSSFDRLLSLTSLPPVSVYCPRVNACLTEFCKCFLPEGACLPYGVFSCKCLLPDSEGLPYDSSCKCLLPEGERLPYGVSFCSSWLMFFLFFGAAIRCLLLF
jgi:hypothetical protein